MNKKILIGGLLLSLFSLTVFGQEKEYSQHVFSVQAGYGNLLKSSKLLTKNTDAYRSQLRDGLAWNASYTYNFLPIIGAGLLYAGQTSEASYDEGADKLYMHYIAPQFYINAVNSKRALVSFHTGIGYMMYRNYSEVFGKDRKVRSTSLGLNIGMKADYKLTSHWGIGVSCLFITSTPDWSKITYHDEEVSVNQKNYLAPLSLTGGISYHF